jgi:pimeloyl-ACP methyl ester carboxylesterase
VPPGVAPAGLPLLVCLHGAGGDHRSAFDDLGIDRFLAQATAAGVPAFAVASVDGGAHGYWHPRTTGGDAGAMVTRELIPLLRARFGLGGRFGLYGWSMGGYGALRLAMRGAGAGAVVASSPALFSSYPSSAPGAFDDEADFVRQGLHDQGARFPRIPVRIDIGTDDPFYAVVHEFVGQMSPAPAGGFEAGAHTDGYWRRMLPAQLAFVGAQLA